MKCLTISTGSSGNAYLFYNDMECLIIEAGCKLKYIKEALNFDISKIVGCVISHSHG